MKSNTIFPSSPYYITLEFCIRHRFLQNQTAKLLHYTDSSVFIMSWTIVYYKKHCLRLLTTLLVALLSPSGYGWHAVLWDENFEPPKIKTSVSMKFTDRSSWRHDRMNYVHENSLLLKGILMTWNERISTWRKDTFSRYNTVIHCVFTVNVFER